METLKDISRKALVNLKIKKVEKIIHLLILKEIETSLIIIMIHSYICLISSKTQKQVSRIHH
jgi:hypothetical protein